MAFASPILQRSPSRQATVCGYGMAVKRTQIVGGGSFGVALEPTDAIGQATLTFSGLQPGTDIVVLRAGTDESLLDLNESPGSSYAYTYNLFSSPTVVDIAFYKAGFVPHASIRSFTLPARDAVLPIAQVPDRNFRNPT